MRGFGRFFSEKFGKLQEKVTENFGKVQENIGKVQERVGTIQESKDKTRIPMIYF